MKVSQFWGRLHRRRSFSGHRKNLRGSEFIVPFTFDCVVHFLHHPFRPLGCAGPEKQEEIALVDVAIEGFLPAFSRLETQRALEVFDA